MPYTGLRDWLEAIQGHGELKHISGANWDLEMSSVAEIIYREGKEPKPAILFDCIPGYPKGYRTLFGQMASPWKIAVTLGLPEDQLDHMKLVQNWRKKVEGLCLIPPKFVTSGPLEDNVDVGEQIDLFKFPSPRFHELDTQRYIGTACAVIQRDPDEGWVNLGTYRVMVVDSNRLALHAIEGQHGSIIMYKKYFARGEVMPIAIAIGMSPALYWSSAIKVPWGTSEYDYAGAIAGEPIEVIKGPYTGLPLPARAEIVIEGECHPGDLVDEGPFGEWHGYYANLGLLPVPEPVIQVKAIHYRDDPILTCGQEAAPPHDDSLAQAVTRSGVMWRQLESLGITGIKGVWNHEMGHGNLFNVISIDLTYSGQSREVGLIASQIGTLGRYTVVVEEDIDPSNLEQVIWAIVTRVTPERSIQIIEHCRSGSHDPAIPLEEKKRYPIAPKPLDASRVIIDACRDLKYKGEWYQVVKVSPELRTKILDKWQSALFGII